MGDMANQVHSAYIHLWITDMSTMDHCINHCTVSGYECWDMPAVFSYDNLERVCRTNTRHGTDEIKKHLCRTNTCLCHCVSLLNGPQKCHARKRAHTSIGGDRYQYGHNISRKTLQNAFWKIENTDYTIDYLFVFVHRHYEECIPCIFLSHKWQQFQQISIRHLPRGVISAPEQAFVSGEGLGRKQKNIGG